MSAPSRPLVVMLSGSDPALLSAAVSQTVDRIVGDGDRTLLVDEFADEEYELRSVVDAAQTPPFLSDYRVVLARGVDRFGSADAQTPLLAYLESPLESSTLVLVWGGGRVSKKLLDALKSSGAEIQATAAPTRAKERQGWLDDRVAEAGVVLDAAATRELASRLGEDVGRLNGVLDILVSTYGAGTRLGIDELAPFLGESGGVPPWDLTDAIDKGDIPTALSLLHRMMSGGERHPLQIMATLHTHFGRMLRLDGAPVGGEKEAAAYLGMKGSTFPAKKALGQVRKLGSDRIARAIGLLADADLQLRGAIDWPDELVMDVLVARLTRLGGR